METLSRATEGRHLYVRPLSLIVAPDFIGRKPWLFVFGELPCDSRLHHTLTRAVYEIFDLESQVGVSVGIGDLRHAERAPIEGKDIVRALRQACTQQAIWFEARGV